MYQIIKVLNNNAILAGYEGSEQILLGQGNRIWQEGRRNLWRNSGSKGLYFGGRRKTVLSQKRSKHYRAGIPGSGWSDY